MQLVNAPFVIFEGIISPIVLSWEPFSKVTDASLRQLENAPAWIVFTLAGISMEINEIQP